MPASSQAVPMPTPVPSSRISPAGFEATSVRNNDPVCWSEDMVKPRLAAACASSFTTAGGLRLVVSSILVAPCTEPLFIFPRGSSRSTPPGSLLFSVWFGWRQPERDVARLHRFLDHREQMVTQLVQVNFVS